MFGSVSSSDDTTLKASLGSSEASSATVGAEGESAAWKEADHSEGYLEKYSIDLYHGAMIAVN